jgi:protein-L-isoaspartate(D-aspartate) O-methyltransferase
LSYSGGGTIRLSCRRSRLFAARHSLRVHKFRATISARQGRESPARKQGRHGVATKALETHMQDFAAERATMVDTQIRTNDVTNKALLVALYSVPREAYVPTSTRPLSYMDTDVTIQAANGSAPCRALVAPMLFAKLAQLAAVGPSDKVLDIGAGTGYSTAVFARIANSVVGLECSAPLAAEAQKTLSAQGIGNASVQTGPLEAGCPSGAPYDVIFINGSANAIPETLFAQLAEGGRLVAVIARSQNGKGYLFQKIKGEISGRPMFDAGAPQLPGFIENPGFVF